jgi:hypothetical protein
VTILWKTLPVRYVLALAAVDPTSSGTSPDRPVFLASFKTIATDLWECHYEGMKSKPQYVEGLEAFARFQGAMQKALSVPHAELQRRIDAERQKSALNPHRRGPKPKTSA